VRSRERMHNIPLSCSAAPVDNSNACSIVRDYFTRVTRIWTEEVTGPGCDIEISLLSNPTPGEEHPAGGEITYHPPLQWKIDHMDMNRVILEVNKP